MNKQPVPVSIKQLARVFETLPPKYEVEITYSDKTKEKKALTAKYLITSYGSVLSNSQYNHFALAAQRDEVDSESDDDSDTCCETTITLQEEEGPPEVKFIIIHKGRLESLPLQFPVTVYYSNGKQTDEPCTAKDLLLKYGHMLTKSEHAEAMKELFIQLEWEERRRREQEQPNQQ